MLMLLYMYFMNMKEFEGTNWEELAAKSQVQDVQLWQDIDDNDFDVVVDDDDYDGNGDNDFDNNVDDNNDNDDHGNGGDDDDDGASKMIIILYTYQSIALFQQARRLGG